MRRRLIILTVISSLLFSTTAYAWDIDPMKYTDPYQAWHVAEGMHEIKSWAEERKDMFAGIANEEERYKSIVSYVVDYLDYDATYTNPVIYYTLRDGKGVCADYVALTEALCDVSNIRSNPVKGHIAGGSHMILNVTINGEDKLSDPTLVWNGGKTVYSLDKTWVTETPMKDLEDAINYTGSDMSDPTYVDNSKKYMWVVSATGLKYCVLRDDFLNLNARDLIAKYNIE